MQRLFQRAKMQHVPARYVSFLEGYHLASVPAIEIALTGSCSSSSINFHVPVEAGQLNRTILSVIQCWSNRPVYWLNAYLYNRPHLVIVILGATFAARAELDHFSKCVLRGSLGAGWWIVKISQRVRRTRISYLGIIR